MKKTLALLTFLILLAPTSSYGQFWKDLRKKAKEIEDAAGQINRTAQQVNDAVNTVKAVVASWKPDTASNVKYAQIPDFRREEEVPIQKNQRLKFENGEFRDVSWEPVTRFYNNVFPSFIIGWANYRGDKYEDMGSSLGFKFKTGLRNAVIKWEITCSDPTFFETDSGYLNLDNVKSSNYFMPKIRWNYRNLVAHKSNLPVTITFRIIDPVSKMVSEKVEGVNLRSINDCLLQVEQKKFLYLFASYVNEDHSQIDGILKKMLDTKMISSISGYQSGVPGDVFLQVAALWKVLGNMGFQYSSITKNSGNSDNSRVFTQSVRTFDQVLKNKQANCVDGTVFMASILQKIGIRTVLVTVPGHCFLGFLQVKTPKVN